MDISDTNPFPPGGSRSLRPPVGPTLVEWAHEHLFSILLSRQIAPGARIGIEALSRLEAEKLVHKVTNVGYAPARR
jgi:DNA-binding GntR family transcriptional regulator